MGRSKQSQSLIDVIKSLPAVERPRVPSWADVLQREDPEKFLQVKEVILDFLNHGVTKQKFPTVASLHLFLSGKDPDRPIPPLVNCGVQGFRAYVVKLRGMGING